MSRQASVLSSEALEALDNALARFCDRAEEAMCAVEPEIGRGLDLLEERRLQWEREVERWQEEYDGADHEEDDIGYIRGRLEEAEEQLSAVERWQARVEDCHQDYSRQAGRMGEVASERIGEARAFLQEKLERLRSYSSGQASRPSRPFTPGIAASSPAPSNPPAPNDSSPGRTVAPGTMAESAAARITDSPLPAGFRWVRLDEISAQEMNDLPGESDFKKVSYEEVKRGFEVLKNEVLPAIKQDPANADSDYFWHADRRAGLDEWNGAQRVFNAFFGRTGKDHIYLGKKAGEPYFNITNGRHRIKVARDLGWPAVPAEVSEVK
jgi:hypothetical protein